MPGTDPENCYFQAVSCSVLLKCRFDDQSLQYADFTQSLKICLSGLQQYAESSARLAGNTGNNISDEIKKLHPIDATSKFQNFAEPIAPLHIISTSARNEQEYMIYYIIYQKSGMPARTLRRYLLSSMSSAAASSRLLIFTAPLSTLT